MTVVAPARRTCSRAGCRRDAVQEILWRNPKLHAPDRSKSWLACGDHAGFLTDFLAARGFPLEARPLDPVR